MSAQFCESGVEKKRAEALPIGALRGARVEAGLPAKVLRWDEQLQVDFLATSASAGNAANAEDASTPGVARSRCGSNLPLPPGLEAPPGTPSHGSTLHGTGHCQPCAWFWKPSGCQNGRECGHCHVCPEGEIKARKKNKLTMMRLGLATPKAEQAAPEGDSLDSAFALAAGAWLRHEAFASNSKQGSTTGSGSEQGSLSSTASTIAAPDGDSSDFAFALAAGSWLRHEAFAANSDQESTTGSGSEQDSLSSTGSTVQQRSASPSTERGSAVHESTSGSESELWEPCPFGPPPGLQVANTRARTASSSHGRGRNRQVAMRLGLVTPKQDLDGEQDTRFAIGLAART